MLQCFEAAAKVTFDYDWNKYIGSHLYFSGQARLDEEDSNGCFKNLGAKCRSYKIMKKQPPEDFRLKTANLDSVRWAQLFLHLWKKMFFFVLKISNGTSQTVFFQSASDPILILSLCVFFWSP